MSRTQLLDNIKACMEVCDEDKLPTRIIPVSYDQSRTLESLLMEMEDGTFWRIDAVKMSRADILPELLK